MREICELCGSGKKLTVQEWNECPVQLADWKAGTYYPFFPRFLTYWWYFRKNPQHLKNKPMQWKIQDPTHEWDGEEVELTSDKPPMMHNFKRNETKLLNGVRQKEAKWKEFFKKRVIY